MNAWNAQSEPPTAWAPQGTGTWPVAARHGRTPTAGAFDEPDVLGVLEDSDGDRDAAELLDASAHEGLASAPEEHARARRIAVLCPDSSIDAACFGAALAAYLAKVSTARDGAGRGVVLVDGQPGTGGLDVVLDLETIGGARWPALRGAGSHVDGERLVAALPQRDGVAVLSHAASTAVVDDESRRATHAALASVADAVVHCIAAHPGPEPGEFDVLVLLVRGTVASMAAVEHTVRTFAERADVGRVESARHDAGPAPDTVVALVALETPERARAVMADGLGAPLVAAAPTRWRMGAECPKDLLAGRWPGQRDATMTRLVRDVSMFVAGLERVPSWA